MDKTSNLSDRVVRCPFCRNAFLVISSYLDETGIRRYADCRTCGATGPLKESDTEAMKAFDLKGNKDE